MGWENYGMTLRPALVFCMVFTALLKSSANSQTAAGKPAAAADTISGPLGKFRLSWIEEASARLEEAKKEASLFGSGADKAKALYDRAQRILSKLSEVSPNGGLYTELKKSIDSTDAHVKSYHDKSIDPKISAETQLRYRTLENRLSGVKERLYNGMMALDAQRVDLEKYFLATVEDMELLAYLLAIGDPDYFANAQTAGGKPATAGDTISGPLGKFRLSGIEEASARLEEAKKKASLFGSGADKAKALYDLAQQILSELSEVSPYEGLYTELKKSIDSTDARAKAYHDKSIDPKLSAETQLRYRTLENRLTTVKDKLYKGMMALDIRRIDLEKRLLTAVENMEFFADSIASGDTEYFLED